MLTQLLLHPVCDGVSLSRGSSHGQFCGASTGSYFTVACHRAQKYMAESLSYESVIVMWTELVVPEVQRILTLCCILLIIRLLMNKESHFPTWWWFVPE